MINKKMMAFCGTDCAQCEWKDKFKCRGCQACRGRMFWGKCDKAKCCLERGYEHCGFCPDMPCQELLDLFADPEHGDDGTRLNNLRNWANGYDVSEKEKDIRVYKNHFETISELFELDSTFHIIAGPCSVESSEQMEQTSQLLVKNGVSFLRGGAYKPRTSPYDFQGLGFEGLKILNDMRDKYGLKIVSEIMDPRDIEKALNYIDVIQIGSRNMTNFSLLKEAGKTKYPVLLKRGMMSTYEEFIYAAEYILSAGNSKVIMCERGIRTFETITRNTIDIASVAMIKHKSSLPIVVDLSHSLGRKDILPPVLKSIMALNIDGIMLEVHPDPQNAKSDSYQQLNFNEFEQILDIVKESGRRKKSGHK